jgi:predicted CXXCH cytochrome family protein
MGDERRRLRLIVLVWSLCLSSAGKAAADPGTGPSPGAPSRPVDMEGKTCNAAGCHDTLQAKRFVHGPAAQATCAACHAQPDPGVHSFRWTYPPEKLCAACHTMREKNFLHTPVLKGECTGCHDPHQSDHRFLLREDPATRLCLTCHEKDAFMERDHLHDPVGTGACILCHESHSSWNPNLLVQQGRELCFFCHQDVAVRIAEARHVHDPLKNECTACHDPHGAEHRQLLTRKNRTLCLSCHEKTATLIETSPHTHGALTVRDACANCHGAHATMLPRLLKAPQLDLCLTCHDRPIEGKEGRMVADMATLLRDNPVYHGPVGRADCNTCHNPHAAANFRLLVKNYPAMFYAPFDLGTYDLCFQCHLREMVLVKEGRGLTRFKDGNRNLHFVHVNQKTKGRTCRACHAVHASRNPLHLRDAVPFGPQGWTLQLNFEKTPTGGRCTSGCHQPEEYNRAPGDDDLPPPRTKPPPVNTGFPEPRKDGAR